MQVKESLAWLTDVHEAWTGEELRVKLRVEPRRYYEISFVLKRYDKAILDAALFANVLHETATVPDRLRWSLPIWCDMQKLGADLAAGVGTVSGIVTAGYDFRAGGLVALIKARASYEFNRFACLRPEDYELMTIDTFDANSITFTDTTTKDFNAGSLLLPVRVARLDSPVDIVDALGGAQSYDGTAAFQCEVAE